MRQLFTRYNERFISALFVSLFIVILFNFAQIRIIDTSIPHSVNSIEATFYIAENSAYTKLGKGLISEDSTIYNDASSVSELILSEPNYDSLLSNDEYIEWDTICTILGQKRILGSVKTKNVDSSNNSTTLDDNSILKLQTFSTLSEMLASNLKVGDRVATKGYYTIGDCGSAIYNISASPSSYGSKLFSYKLKNDLYANLEYDETTILNVASVGIMPDTEISANINLLSEISEGHIAGIKFNNGTYYINNQVYLRSLKYYGSENTTIQATNDFNPKAIRLLLTDVNNTTKRYNIYFENITFKVIGSSNHNLKNSRIQLMALTNIDSCEINNCRFLAVPDSTNPIYMSVDLLWFQHSDLLTNIKIKNTDFIFLLGENYTGNQSDYITGGCLWFSGNSKSSIINNVAIENCNFTNSVNDESFAFWSCNASNISINDCNFTNYSHASNNVITFYDCITNDISFNSCNININVPTDFVFKTTNVGNSSSININNCHFIFSHPNTSLPSTAVFFMLDNEATSNTALTFNVNSSVFETITDCEYKSIFWLNKLNNKTINANNNIFRMNVSEAIIDIMNTSYANLSFVNNYIDYNGLFANYTSIGTIDVSAIDNIFVKNCTSKINQHGTLNYEFKNNICNGDAKQYILFANWLDTSYPASKLILSKNQLNNSAISIFENNRPNVSNSNLVTIVE